MYKSENTSSLPILNKVFFFEEFWFFYFLRGFLHFFNILEEFCNLKKFDGGLKARNAFQDETWRIIYFLKNAILSMGPKQSAHLSFVPNQKKE